MSEEETTPQDFVRTEDDPRVGFHLMPDPEESEGYILTYDNSERVVQYKVEYDEAGEMMMAIWDVLEHEEVRGYQ